ncbi:hypothetical protein H181DRAFT_03511 [Streptomyces sp. WMMB 714]|jgi:hypothetical protein|uniref:Uncharacterized protein n=1 Tax=Streptomyces daqingensis TaxID=1472640 RepID=A0ABQ2M257_9ACTN|nr:MULTISPECIES: hypothetical protein [Streptomyces]GGO45988.1 hypothetical protein GCM10012287_15240 [Streptomyces daqingensis]SCK40406.1 hypothetical protein H181DRAFT_03511 [Streptomyces sp. WMMB 714]
MPRILKALVVCSLLIGAAVAPAVAAEEPQTTTAHGVHTNGTTEGHTP